MEMKTQLILESNLIPAIHLKSLDYEPTYSTRLRSQVLLLNFLKS